MLWIVPLLCAVSGTALLAWLAARVRREVGPTQTTLRSFGQELRPVLLEVRDEAAELRARLRNQRES